MEANNPPKLGGNGSGVWMGAILLLGAVFIVGYGVVIWVGIKRWWKRTLLAWYLWGLVWWAGLLTGLKQVIRG